MIWAKLIEMVRCKGKTASCWYVPQIRHVPSEGLEFTPGLPPPCDHLCYHNLDSWYSLRPGGIMMNQSAIPIAILAFLVPVMVVFLSYQDQMVEEDLSRGTLLYFTSSR